MKHPPRTSLHVVTFRYGHRGNPDAAILVPHGLDVSRVAAHMQFRAEEWFDQGAVLYSKGVAEALVRFYGCTEVDMPSRVPSWPDPKAIDLYWVRETMCGEDISLHEDPALAREGLKEFLSTRYSA